MHASTGARLEPYHVTGPSQRGHGTAAPPEPTRRRPPGAAVASSSAAAGGRAPAHPAGPAPSGTARPAARSANGAAAESSTRRRKSDSAIAPAIRRRQLVEVAPRRAPTGRGPAAASGAWRVARVVGSLVGSLDGGNALDHPGRGRGPTRSTSANRSGSDLGVWPTIRPRYPCPATRTVSRRCLWSP